MSQEQPVSWRARHEQWLRYVEAIVQAVNAGESIPTGPSAGPLMPAEAPISSGHPAKVLVCSPHPDDECLVGALPLRLRLEAGVRVVNCAVTLGSNPAQKTRRLRELESACRVIGFDLVVPQPPSGFEQVNPEARRNHPEEWAKKVETLRAILDQQQPDVVFAPHAEDFNTTHIGTHLLAEEALRAHLEPTDRGSVMFIEAEFWHQHAQPNLMVGVSPQIEAILIMATAEHGGEVSRNPYHLLHAGRMMDNVRRGSEVVGGQGSPAHRFPFAELYRVSFRKGKQVIIPRPGGHIIGPQEKIDVDSLKAKFWPEGH